MSLSELIEVLNESKALLGRADNDFTWSSWANAKDAQEEIELIISSIQAGTDPESAGLSVLFAPTGPMQEVSLSSGWAQEFLDVAERFDAAIGVKRAYPKHSRTEI